MRTGRNATDDITKLHPDLDVFRVKGGLFDVEPGPLDANIGRRCRFVKPCCVAEKDVFTVATVQKNWRGELCYRVVGDSDIHKFGRVASPEQVRFF